MNAFFVIAGVTVTVIGIIAIGVIVGVYISVRYFGNEINLRHER